MKNTIYPFIRKCGLIFILSITIMSGFHNSLYAQVQSPDDTASVLPAHQLLLFGDMGYAKNDDMNNFTRKGAEDIAAEYTASGFTGYSAGSTSKADKNYGWDLEYRFFYETLGFGFSTGWHRAVAKTKVSNPDTAISEEVSLYVIPFTVTIYYKYIISDNCFFAFGAGIGAYYSEIDPDYSGVDDGVLYHGYFNKRTNDWAGDSTTIGCHIKADYNYLLGPVCLTAGIGARYVKFNEFENSDINPVKLEMNAGLTGVNVYAGAGIAW